MRCGRRRRGAGFVHEPGDYSLYAFYVQAVFIGAICIYCLISALLTLLLHFSALLRFTLTRFAGRRAELEATARRAAGRG